MTKRRWHYVGDINIEHGGYFWCEDGQDDYVRIVRVTPASDMEGPDNVFMIESGSVYLPTSPTERKQVLKYLDIGYTENTSLAWLVEAFLSYSGIDNDAYNDEQYVRIGPEQDMDRKNSDYFRRKINRVLRASASLENYVKRECLD
jgi:hypothetical protein